MGYGHSSQDAYKNLKRTLRDLCSEVPTALSLIISHACVSVAPIKGTRVCECGADNRARGLCAKCPS